MGSIYLDHNATTPLDPRALAAMMPFLTEEYGNPSSSTHDWGLRARQAVEEGRRNVAALLGARPGEIVFTAGATESNNLAIKGAARCRRDRGRHLITTSIEHASVLATARDLETAGFELTVVDPDSEGVVHPETIASALRSDTILVSVVAASGEIGTLEPVGEIGSLCRERGVLFHTDATQIVGRIPVDVGAMGADLLSLSAHKLYGPKGTGALYVREGVEIEPVISGGGQERGLRSGTLNVPGIVGMGTVARLCIEEMDEMGARESRLVERLWEGILRIAPDARRNGHARHRLPCTLNVAIPRVNSERLLLLLKGFALSATSACASGQSGPSRVLTALGLDPELASCSLRIGVGKSTTEEQVDQLLAALDKAVRRVRGPAQGALTEN
jgi:cysteine desulfurase